MRVPLIRVSGRGLRRSCGRSRWSTAFLEVLFRREALACRAKSSPSSTRSGVSTNGRRSSSGSGGEVHLQRAGHRCRREDAWVGTARWQRQPGNHRKLAWRKSRQARSTPAAPGHGRLSPGSGRQRHARDLGQGKRAWVQPGQSRVRRIPARQRVGKDCEKDLAKRKVVLQKRPRRSSPGANSRGFELG